VQKKRGPRKTKKKEEKAEKEEDLKYIYYFHRPTIVQSLWKYELEDGDVEREV